jgi:hypothetical protein
MPALLPLVLTASHLMLVSDVPVLKVEPSCRAVATAAVGANRDENACLREERRAHGKLQQQWDQFSSADQTRCLRLSHLGGHPSYVELLTCLQVAKAAKALPGDGTTTGMGQ